MTSTPAPSNSTISLTPAAYSPRTSAPIAASSHPFDRGSRQGPDRLHDDGDDHRLDPVQEPYRLRRRSVSHVDPGERQRDERRRQDEQRAGQDETAPAGPRVAQVDRQLGRGGAGDEIAGAEQIEELLLGHPAPPRHDLVAHERDVRRGPAECDEAELQEERGDLAQRSRVRRSGVTHLPMIPKPDRARCRAVL
jgi:hypothetical protein